MTAVPSKTIRRARRHVPQLSVLGLLAMSTVELPAQRWSERWTLSPRRRAGMAYDADRGRTVMFGGVTSRGTTYSSTVRETWEWDGAVWTRREPLPNEPQGTELARATAYDPFSRRVLMLLANASLNTTEFWAWEGRTWQSVTSTTRPDFRVHHAAAFDETRRRFVLWGGSNVNGALLDVWEWDGTDWMSIGNPGPPGRNEPALAYDGVRGKVLMFGGRAAVGGQPLADTWEWDGTTWTQLTPATTPPARNGHSMTWDPVRRRVVMYGGGSGTPGTVLNDTWEWNGTDWTRVNTATAPPARSGHCASFHGGTRNRVTIACGENASGLLGDSWEFDGSNWVEIYPLDTPTPRSDHAAVFDSGRNEILLFGGRDSNLQGVGDTWRWRVWQWRRLAPATSPSSRWDHAMAYDSARNRVVLFGGFTSSAGVQGDTWLWDGTTWTQASPATSPSARFGHAMAFDSARGRVVLFGGSLASSVLLNDTWEWNGTNWQQITTNPSPIGRAEHGMAYDAANSRIVLFGGRNTASTYRQDTWTYDGTTWTDRNTSNVTVRGNLGMDYDPIRARVVLFGGKTSASGFSQTAHEWNGTAWSSPFIVFTPALRGGHTLTWDGTGRRFVAFGGENTAGKRSDVWIYTYNAKAQVQALPPQANCSGPGGGAQIIGYGIPHLGNASFTLDLVTPNPPTPASPVFYLLSIEQAANGVRFGNCQLTVDPVSLFFTAYRLQRGVLATLPMPIPPNTSLLTASFIAQCMYLDPPTPFNGMAFSLGARVTIGDF